MSHKPGKLHAPNLLRIERKENKMETQILITGASSGPGLAFLKHYIAQHPSTRIIAIDIAPLPSTLSFPNVDFLTADISSESSLASVAAKMHGMPIHLLIHSAGVRGLVPEAVREKRGDVAAAETYEAMNYETVMRTLEINTWDTFNLIKTFLPNLQKASLFSCRAPPPKVIVMSSRMGSIAANTAGGGFAYRTSKAGLNAIVKSFSIDVSDVVFLLLHPGRVETGLVDWKEEGAMSVEESLQTCLEVIDKAGKGDGGTFVDRFGKEIQW